MGDTLKITLRIFILGIFITLKSKEATSDSEPMTEFFQLTDSQPLTLNKSYCLDQISAKMLSSSSFGEQNRSLYYVQIMWNSKFLMTSLKLESNSLNDSYCEAENKHYYFRKPLNQSVHVFPDEVNEGIRFLPIKLDCNYIITPELEGMCWTLKLRYSTPVCIDNRTCSCRNVNMSGPNLGGKLESDGINVFWSFPDDFQHNISKIVFLIFSEDGINVRELSKRIINVTNANALRRITNNQYFQMNITTEYLYRVQGYFENQFRCRGNSTFLLLQQPGILKRLSYDKILSYTLALLLLLVTIFMCLVCFLKKQVKMVCMKLLPLGSSEAPDSQCINSENLRRKEFSLPKMVWNLSYLEQSRDTYLFDYRDLKTVKEIASGNFGIVYLAYTSVSLRGCNEFAIKQIKDKAGSEGVSDFLEEINIFKLVGDHPNVVKMFGYCSAPQPLTIIMEYVPFNLLIYLKNLREEFDKRKSKIGNSVNYAQLSHSRISSSSSCSLTDYNYISQNEIECMPLKEYQDHELEYVLDNKELEVFGLQIARGMAHLEFKNIVHRDLAARNVLMDHAKVLKISDFGMSRSGIYVNKRSKKFPLRWMSPEALMNRVYSNKSDVWSFGVVLWEIGTLGAFPYSSLQNEEVISLLEKGGHLDKPENVTSQLYNLMVNCWARSPNDRPTFKNLVEKIEGFCQKSNGYVDFENLESNYDFPPMEEDIEKAGEKSSSSSSS